MKAFSFFSMLLMALSMLWCPAPVSLADSDSKTVYFDMVIDETRQKIYGSDFSYGAIDVISMSTLEVISSIPVGATPTGIDLSPDGNELAVALMDQSEIAFVDLQTLTVAARVTPEVTIGPNKPYDILYGRPGRLYSVGNPDSSGIDYVHVFDTSTKLEVGHSKTIVRAAPRLAMTVDKNTLYVSDVNFSPQLIYRIDISTDTPDHTAIGTDGPLYVNTLCVAPNDNVFTSGGQMLPADLSNVSSG